MLPPLPARAVMVRVESVTFDGVKNRSLVMMFSDLPANIKFICWVFSSNRVTPIWSFRFSKFLITALASVPPFVLKVSSTLSFFRTTGWFLPFCAA